MHNLSVLEGRKHLYVESGCSYLIRHIPSHDQKRQDEYQRLRADVFVKAMGWRIPVDSQGRERDRYDIEQERYHVNIYGVYGQAGQTELLLGGLRLLTLQSWQDSMLANEFVSMFPAPILRALFWQDAQKYIEITRFCVRRGRWYPALGQQRFSCITARDLTYAAAYAVAFQTRRTLAVAAVDPQYMKIMQRSEFAFHSLCVAPNATLVIIDLMGTIRRIRAAGDEARAQRMLAMGFSYA
ncbi:MAG TPA: acyl-homoserine-lactone synthase [Ktedonobacteraceae bacterium]|nr:acyl-homoserine-lactone synthase [Ktedonobacteraceae bacterium]